jgi:cytochrome c
MVSYILGLGSTSKTVVKKPAAEGTFTPEVPANDNGRGSYLLRVAYKDKGTEQMTSLTSEKIVALRNPTLDPEKADVQKGTVLMTTPTRSFSLVGNNSYIGYKGLDLSGIQQVEMLVSAQPRSGALGGVIEVHLDSPDGPVIGKTETIVPKDIDFGTAIAAMQAQASKAGKKLNPAAGAAGMDFSLLRRFMSIVTKAPIQATEGIHDVYFVFTNPQAKENETIAQAVEITFQNAILP